MSLGGNRSFSRYSLARALSRSWRFIGDSQPNSMQRLMAYSFAIVERAKEYAIKRCIELGCESPMNRQDLLSALAKEYRENDLFPPSDITEDWLKLTDFDPGNVVRLAPYRSDEQAHSTGTI